MTLVAQPHTDDTDFVTEVVVPEGGTDLKDRIAEHTRVVLDTLDPERGRMLAAVWLRPAALSAGAGVLVLTAHVLALDPASWRIMLGELDAGWHALAQRRRPAPVPEHTSYRQWSALLRQRADSLDTSTSGPPNSMARTRYSAPAGWTPRPTVPAMWW